jgi:hypothetical protein
MVVQYPHILIATTVTESHQDINGNWISGSTITWENICRAEPNNGGKSLSVTVNGVDGAQIVYSWAVYLPKGTTTLPHGTPVVITSNGDTIATGSVLRFSQGQLNSRLWL